MSYERLPFWQFFIDIEQQLSYERWIDKYQLFIQTLAGGAISFDPEWAQFKLFCKALYLQNHADEVLFELLLDEAIVREKQWLLSHLDVSEAMPGNLAAEPVGESKGGATGPEEEKKNEVVSEEPVAAGADSVSQQAVSTGVRDLYFLPPVGGGVGPQGAGSGDAGGASGNESFQHINYLLTDEYFPVTRRQMVKGWQFLRNKEKGGWISDIDLPATVEKIARDGLFLAPVYRPGMRNRMDTLIIFADCRGSMSPFHELTRRLVEAAHGEGGHQRAQVFYFQNYPLGMVYRHANLHEPVKVKEALFKTNRNFTLAIVISDAGAARGNTDLDAINTRVSMMDPFIAQLDESCAHTIWINPMPRHRWKGTAAEKIEEKVFLMMPILEEGQYSFQDALRSILKQHLKKVQNK